MKRASKWNCSRASVGSFSHGSICISRRLTLNSSPASKSYISVAWRAPAFRAAQISLKNSLIPKTWVIPRMKILNNRHARAQRLIQKILTNRKFCCSIRVMQIDSLKIFCDLTETQSSPRPRKSTESPNPPSASKSARWSGCSNRC